MALPEYGPIEQGADMRRVIDAVIDAYAKSGDHIGDSDLYDEQPHSMHLPLGIVRLAMRTALWRNAYRDVADAHKEKSRQSILRMLLDFERSDPNQRSWTPAQMRARRELGIPEGITAMAWAPNGKLPASADAAKDKE